MIVLADTVALLGTIAAIVAAVAGLLALWAVFQRFRLKLDAKFDERRQAIRVEFDNQGRASRFINAVAVVDPKRTEVPATVAGLPDGRFSPTELPGRTSWYLILAADRAAGAFPGQVQVRVEWGRRRTRLISPTTTSGTAYYGLNSKWPAG
jgi:hypothetical protein